MHQWPLLDILALSRIGKLSNAKRIALVEDNKSLQGALVSLGALELDVREEAARILADSHREEVCILTYWHTEYPARLRGLDQPPMVLYIRGNVPDTQLPCIGVVGTRSCTVGYGKPVTDTLVKAWTEAGCAIISGLANGIDMLSHEACLRWRGCTVAVIASGLGRITPIAAQRMADRIAKNGGAVVSEHPVFIAAKPPYFPARNRIIAGLSDAVVVVESKATGGALITADFSRRQHTPVWAVPGPINSTRSVGTNALIASGQAQMLTSAQKLLDTLFANNHQPSTPMRSHPISPIVERLGADPIGVEGAAAAWNCTIPEAIVRLFNLEIEGLVQGLPGGRYAAYPKRD